MSATENDIELAALLTNMAIPTDADRSIGVSQARTHVAWDYDTIAYTSVWPAGQELPLILRSYYSRLTYWQIEDLKKPEKVWAVLRRLRLDGFPCPRPLAQGMFGQTPYLIWLSPPGELWPAADDDFSARAKPLIPHLADLLARLHALDHNGLNNEPLYQATVAGTLVRMLLWGREMQNEELRQMIARLKPPVAQLQSWYPRLIHGEAHLGNVMVQDGRIIALCNWEHAAIGDPRWDVMTAAYWLRQRDPELADQLVNWYETLTGRVITERLFWYALISVRLWAVKSWLAYAVKTQKVSSRNAAWVSDLAQVRDNALRDLQVAGL